MSFFKFSKFSKFLSTCFAFSFLFSGSQTYSMESRNLGNRINLDMLGIGIRNNLGGDNESAATKSTVASPLDGIEFKIPEHCKFCNQKVARVVAVRGGVRFYICKNDNCIQKCYDEFLISNGLKLRQLDLNANNVPRCEDFKTSMKNIEKLKKANYECPGISEQECRQLCEQWERFNEDKLLEVGFIRCGHSICYCNKCVVKLVERGEKFKRACPKCKAEFGCIPDIYVARVNIRNSKGYAKAIQFFEEKLNGDWGDRVICLSNNSKAVNVAGVLSSAFKEYGPSFRPSVFVGIYRLNENRFNRVNDVLSLGEKFLVADGRAPVGKSLHFIEISKLNGYIESLIKNGEYGCIVVYPVKGKLHDEIEAIAIKFIKDNTITVPKKMYDEIQTGILDKMFKDDIE